MAPKSEWRISHKQGCLGFEDTQSEEKGGSMKVVILAGGFGTRMSEMSHLRPKPMIEIGDKPILWHIMKYFSSYGYHDFIICCGYKQYEIKSFFSNYYLHVCNVTFDFARQDTVLHNRPSEPWKVTLVDTGLQTMTGGRIKRIKDHLEEEPFFLTYGDGLSDVNLEALLDYHKRHDKTVTLTAVRPEGRFGALELDSEGKVGHFREKVLQDGGWINGGFMVCQPELLKYIDGDHTILEEGPLERLASKGQLCALKHDGFWQCMDTVRDKSRLESIWQSGQAPWKRWEE